MTHLNLNANVLKMRLLVFRIVHADEAAVGIDCCPSDANFTDGS